MMTPIRYEIARVRGAWRIVTDRVEGGPYLSKDDAVADATAAATMLRKAGEAVVVCLPN